MPCGIRGLEPCFRAASAYEAKEPILDLPCCAYFRLCRDRERVQLPIRLQIREQWDALRLCDDMTEFG
jgi:hypothetical protein